MANESIGAQQYLALVDESTWGTFPGTPTYYHVPVTEYGVEFQPVNRQAKPYLGIFSQKNNKNYKGMPSGNLNAPLYGWKPTGLSTSIAQCLLDWSFADPTSAFPRSKSAEWAIGPNVANKRHSGLRVNQATLSGNEDSGEVDISLGLMGKSEVGNDIVTAAQTIPNSRNLAVSMEFADATFALAGSAILLSSFQLSLSHGLKAKHLNSFTPSVLMKTQRVITLNFKPILNSDTYEAYNRATSMTEFTGQIVLKGLHNGTGTGGTNWTVCTIDFARLSFVKSAREGGIEDILMNGIDMVALKPDTSSQDVTFTFSEAA
ncbi:MAG: phage tail tube protein [Planctomycetota bacterium]|nr:phage tail tube protein [Planctomycetota bacterium]